MQDDGRYLITRRVVELRYQLTPGFRLSYPDSGSHSGFKTCQLDCIAFSLAIPQAFLPVILME